MLHLARASTLAALAGCLLALTSCGGGGGSGGVPGAATLTGRLLAEQSPPSSPARLDGPAPEREPNDYLFNAHDLGTGDRAVAVHGVVGSPADRVDVLRLGPCASAGALTVRVAGDVAVTCLEAEAAGAPHAARVIARDRDTELAVRAGDELVFVVTAEVAAAWRLDVTAITETPSPARTRDALVAIDPAPDWKRVLGADVQVLPGEVLFCRHESLGDDVARDLGLVLVETGGPVARWRTAAALATGEAGAIAQANLLRAVRRACPDAAYVSPNVMTPLSALASMPTRPNDPLYAKSQFNLALAGFPAAWDITTGDESVAIAVMDTGILSKHPDLSDRISSLGYDFISDPQNALDGDGMDGDPTEPRANELVTWFHGTYVAGVAGAVANNNVGIAGGTWKGEIIPIRIFGRWGGALFDRLQAMRYLAGLTNSTGRVLSAAERPRVVNMSYVYVTATAAERTEITNLASAGVHMVAAAGNDANSKIPGYPAAYPEVIGVGAVDRNAVITTYSSVGSQVDIVGFGGTQTAGPEGIISTWGGTFGGKFQYVYNSFMGTSLAAPSITAAVALMEAVHPRMAQQTLRRILRETSRDLGAPGRDDVYGHGLLQADRAVALAKQLDTPPVLNVDPPSYAFSDDETTTELEISNGGGRLLRDLSVAPIGTTSGATTASIDSDFAPARVTVAVDRDKVKVGTYTDSYEVTSNGGSQVVSLTLRKPIPLPPGTIAVRVFAGATLVASAQTDASGNFEIARLPFGTYRFEAGVDRDQNGRLGDSQEWYLSRTIEVRADRTAGLGDVVVPWKN